MGTEWNPSLPVNRHAPTATRGSTEPLSTRAGAFASAPFLTEKGPERPGATSHPSGMFLAGQPDAAPPR